MRLDIHRGARIRAGPPAVRRRAVRPPPERSTITADAASQTTRARLVGVVALVVLLVLVGGARPGVAPPVAAQTGGLTFTSDPNEAGAGWLADQLDSGAFPVGEAGLATDAILALYGSGFARGSADRALARIPDASVARFVYRGGTSFAPGAAGKALLTRQAAGLGGVWAGIDLEPRIREAMRTTGPRTGEFPTIPSSTVGSGFDQALAVFALGRTAGGAPPAAVDWLLAMQCPGGGFRQVYGLAGTCDEKPGNVDATALAVQALLVVPDTVPVATARARAVAWLESMQRSNGGWSDNDLVGVNTNSSGLAVQALRAMGRTTSVEAGVAYVVARQRGCGFPVEHRGVIGYTSAADDPRSDQVRRAMAQALLALGSPPFGSITAGADREPASTLDCPDTNTTTTTSSTTSTTSTTTSTTTTTTTTTPSPTTQPGDGDGPGGGNGSARPDGGGRGVAGAPGPRGGSADVSGRTGAPASLPFGLLDPDRTDDDDLGRSEAAIPAPEAEPDDTQDLQARVADEVADGPLDAGATPARPESVRDASDPTPVGPAAIAGLVTIGLLGLVGVRSGVLTTKAGGRPRHASKALAAAGGPGAADGSGTRTHDLDAYG